MSINETKLLQGGNWLFKFIFPSAEMKELPVFKNYSPGEPSSRLYIKNLSRHVSEEVSKIRSSKVGHFSLIYVLFYLLLFFNFPHLFFFLSSSFLYFFPLPHCKFFTAFTVFFPLISCLLFIFVHIYFPSGYLENLWILCELE